MTDWIDTERERLFAEAERRDAEERERYLRHVAAMNTGHSGAWAHDPKPQPRGSFWRGWIALALAVLLLVLPVAHVGVKAVANLAEFNANFDCGAC